MLFHGFVSLNGQLVIRVHSDYIHSVMLILSRHIVQRHVTPFLFSVFVLIFVFLLQFVMQKMDQLAGKGLSAGVIAELIAMNLAWMLVLAVPMAVLVATLMAFGNLSSGNEITAMRASGVSLYRMVTPVFIISIVLCALLVQFNNKVLPDANHQARMLMTDIYRKKPTFSIVPGMFSDPKEIQGYSILVRKTFEHTNDLEGVTIFDYTNPAVTTTVTAERGTVSFSPDYQKLIMDLYDGEIHELGTSDFNRYRKIRFGKHRIAMNAEGFDFQRSQESAFSRGDRELSAQAMNAIVDSLSELRDSARAHVAMMTHRELDAIFAPRDTPAMRAQFFGDPVTGAEARMAAFAASLDGEQLRISFYDRKIHEYSVEIYKKYSIPFACIVFVLIGAPLGIMARRGTFGVAASLSLGFFLLYWACLIGGEKLADRGFIDPWFGMWIANILIGIMGLYLTIRTARENLIIDWSFLKRFVPRQWRFEEEPA
ncbi:MAG TPA: LptF/LptG family permease [Bacteroidota bacterium]|nr:LptF/LptG family permease [Bacteroidota bacterium]